MDYNAPGVKSQPPDGLFLRWLPNEDHSEIVDDDDVLFDDERADRTHVWTAPAVQEETDGSAKLSGAAMYPACCQMRGEPSSRCSRYGRWP